MATRATIKIEGIDFAKVYKHWDGYPKGILAFLEKFNTEFTEARGDDPTYKFAQLLRATKRLEDEFNLDSSDVTGYGVIPFSAHASEQFEYTLNSDGSVSYIQPK
jgi:hypothetical protein